MPILTNVVMLSLRVQSAVWVGWCVFSTLSAGTRLIHAYEGYSHWQVHMPSGVFVIHPFAVAVDGGCRYLCMASAMRPGHEKNC